MAWIGESGALIGGRYRLERPLGRAWLAIHAATGGHVVLKPRVGFEDPRAVHQLMHMRHPALPRILDEITPEDADPSDDHARSSADGACPAGEHAGPAARNFCPTGEHASPAGTWLVCEYLEGMPFSEWLQKAGGRLTPEESVPLLAEAARALAFLHEQGEPLLHLDLKPEHFIRLPGGHAGLIDFDCARVLPLEPSTRATVRCTAGFAAPELMANQPEPASDIYAFGVTMLVLLTGHPVGESALPPLEPLCRHLPPVLTGIIADCINTLPERRFASAAALACALERLAAQRGLLRQTAASVAASGQPASGQPARGQPALAQPVLAQPVPGLPVAEQVLSTPCQPALARSVSVHPGAADYQLESMFASPASSAASSPAASAAASHPDASHPDASHLDASHPDASPAAGPEASHPDARACRDQLVVVWDNAAFAAAFSRRLSQRGLETIVIDADLLNPRLDLLLAVESAAAPGPVDDSDQTMHPGLELALTSLMRQTLPPEHFASLLQKTGTPHLRALTGAYQLRDYAFFDVRTLLQLYRLCRMQADAVIVSCSRFLHDSFACLSLLAADLVLIPIQAEPPMIREFNRYLDFLGAQYPFERRKARFIAVDHDPARHLSWGMADTLCGGLLAGCLPMTLHLGGGMPGRGDRPRCTWPGRHGGMADEMEQLIRRLGYPATPARPA